MADDKKPAASGTPKPTAETSSHQDNLKWAENVFKANQSTAQLKEELEKYKAEADFFRKRWAEMRSLESKLKERDDEMTECLDKNEELEDEMLAMKTKLRNAIKENAELRSASSPKSVLPAPPKLPSNFSFSFPTTVVPQSPTMTSTVDGKEHADLVVKYDLLAAAANGHEQELKDRDTEINVLKLKIWSAEHDRDEANAELRAANADRDEAENERWEMARECEKLRSDAEDHRIEREQFNEELSLAHRTNDEHEAKAREAADVKAKLEEQILQLTKDLEVTQNYNVILQNDLSDQVQKLQDLEDSFKSLEKHQEGAMSTIAALNGRDSMDLGRPLNLSGLEDLADGSDSGDESNVDETGHRARSSSQTKAYAGNDLEVSSTAPIETAPPTKASTGEASTQTEIKDDKTISTGQASTQTDIKEERKTSTGEAFTQTEFKKISTGQASTQTRSRDKAWGPLFAAASSTIISQGTPSVPATVTLAGRDVKDEKIGDDGIELSTMSDDSIILTMNPSAAFIPQKDQKSTGGLATTTKEGAPTVTTKYIEILVPGETIFKEGAARYFAMPVAIYRTMDPIRSWLQVYLDLFYMAQAYMTNGTVPADLWPFHWPFHFGAQEGHVARVTDGSISESVKMQLYRPPFWFNFLALVFHLIIYALVSWTLSQNVLLKHERGLWNNANSITGQMVLDERYHNQYASFAHSLFGSPRWLENLTFELSQNFAVDRSAPG